MSLSENVESFKAALGMRWAIVDAPPGDAFARAMSNYLDDIDSEIDTFVHSLSELHDLIDMRRILLDYQMLELVEWVESSIYRILHARGGR